MLDLPTQFVLFDTEYTTWEGAQARQWSGPNEHKELVQIGAIRVDRDSLQEADHFQCLIRPAVNPTLSQYFIDLTGITQAQVDREGIGVEEALTTFVAWTNGLPLYCFGTDGQVIAGQCELATIACPFDDARFYDIRPVFEAQGIPAREYMSSTIVQAFELTLTRSGHDALNDARSILDGLVALEKTLTQ